MNLGDELRYQRKLAGLSQREVAVRAGVWQSTVSAIENGTLDAQVSTFEKVGRVFGLELTFVHPEAVDQATFEASTKTCEHSGDDFTIAGVCTICGWTDQP